MAKYAKLTRTPAPQSEPLTPSQIINNAGGYVFAIDLWSRLDRFLILGSDSQTYYQSARKLTRENAACVTQCYDSDPERTVNRIVEISDSGRAPKNDSAIFALAIGAAHSNVAVRRLALSALSKVCRTGTHLFQFVDCARSLGRGWGRTMKRAVGGWYNAKSVDSAAYQTIKYRMREDYSHKRLLQTAHPSASTPERIDLYRWARGLDVNVKLLPPQVQGHLAAMQIIPSAKDWARLVDEYDLPWEALPTEANAEPEVWQTMVPHLGLTALIRNLGNMSRVGAITPLSQTERTIIARIGNEQDLRKSRVHPFSILLAQATYASGHGFRGKGTWEVSRPIVDALDGAFYAAFANVIPTNKRILLALDVSRSMTSPMGGSPLSCREAAAALALVTMKTEPHTHVVGFYARSRGEGHRYYGRPHGWEDGISPLSISAHQRLDQVIHATSGLPFGGTDCALPMLYAAAKDIDVDAFVVITDNETWSGSVHPAQALKDYRAKTGINAKLVVVGMTSTGFSIADPNDKGMLDVVGFDANGPALVADFIRE